MPERIRNPYAGVDAQTRWYRGNLHAHTTRTDGQLDPQAVLDRYAALGYDFLALSDHDVFTGPGDYAAWDSLGMTLLPGNEVTANGVHVLHIDGDRQIVPDPDRQAALHEIAATRGFAVVAHPNWYARFNHCPQELLDAWSGYAGIEIYNGVIHWLEGSSYALDRWDMLLSAGRQVWGFAHDDSHFFEGIGLGWNQVAASDSSAPALAAALRAGRFYASTGVTIDAIAVDENTATVRATQAHRIAAITRHGRRLAWTDSSELTVSLDAASGYVRFECWGCGERFAWTQPIFL